VKFKSHFSCFLLNITAPRPSSRSDTENLLTYGKSLSRDIFVWLGRVLWPHRQVVDMDVINQAGLEVNCIALRSFLWPKTFNCKNNPVKSKDS